MHFFSNRWLYVNEPIVNMRELPSKDSKVVSQVVFGEEIALEKSVGEWAYIRSSDTYTGWILQSSYVELETPYISNISTSRLSSHLYAIEDTEFGPIKTLAYQTRLQAIGEGDRWIELLLPDQTKAYIQKGDVSPEAKLYTKQDLCVFSQKFLGLPYTWGGRSSFGYDCSGFIQMLYQQISVHLPRDARQQILDPRFKEISVDHLKPGDLLFFGKCSEKIQHVGLYLGDQKFIHATSRENLPWIRISKLTDFEWSGHSDAYYPHRRLYQNKVLEFNNGNSRNFFL